MGSLGIRVVQVLKTLREFFSDVHVYVAQIIAWRSVAYCDYTVSGLKGGRVLIVPCDPWGVVGSRGDQAMILAVKQRCGTAEIDVLTDSNDTDYACREINLNPIAEWNMPFSTWMKDNASRYSNVYILGADVTDGIYGWPTAMKLLMFYDCFARLGVETHYLGFSWSETPSPWMHFVFPFLKRGLPLPVRDPVSYERVARFTRHRPLVQVADAAFQLKPNATPRAQKWIDWCRGKKSEGRRVIAINVHQMFNDAETKSTDWEVAFSRCLEAAARNRRDVIYLLVPHDNRPRVSDLEILRRINGIIPDSTLIDVVMNADEIKAVLGECDALIAGRMHISIAALGQGVPVLGLVYQGKFEGLWEHFGLPRKTLLAPKRFLEDSQFAESVLGDFIDNVQNLSAKIKECLPHVVGLAALNFAR